MSLSLQAPQPKDQGPSALSEPQAQPGLKVTDAQRRAIESRAGDVVVSAGAGSGKTFVLVERFMGLVREEIAPERILTITFTERAAIDMKERIGRALEAEGYPDARRVAEGAWISTIHGFCARLLRERALEAGVDPAFDVLTNVPAARVRRAAFLSALRAFRRERPGTYDALVERVRWGKGQDGAVLIRQQVFDLYDAIRAAGAGFGSADDTDSLDVIEVDPVREALARVGASVFALLSEMSSARQTQTRQRQAAKIRELSGEIASMPLDVFRPELYRGLRTLAKAAKGGGTLAGPLAELREIALDAAGVYAEGPARSLGRGLEDLLRRFDRAFRGLKAAQSALDFTDLEERTRELLDTREDVREDIQRRFLSLLVDEFQDTSCLQQRILDRVRRPGGLFAVGDVKQSIYGFRHANVRGLLDLEREVREGAGEAVTLDLSFRARPEILGYVDEVFSRLWAEAGSEVPHQPLRPGIEFPRAARPCVEFLVGHGESLGRGRQQEARAVAGRLATLIEGGHLQGTNPLRQDTFGRKLRYRDCAILVPATTALPAYERALRHRGVPYRVSSGRGFYAVREVVDAVKLLRVTASAHDELSLLSLLRSPAVGLSDDALLRLSFVSTRGGSLYEVLANVCVAGAEPAGHPPPRAYSPGVTRAGTALVTFQRPCQKTGPSQSGHAEKCLGGIGGAKPPQKHTLTPLDQDRAARAFELIDTLRGMRGRYSTREILAQGLELSGLLDGSLLGSGDVRAFANLQKLLSIVDDLERGGVTGPAAIAGVLEDLRASNARESEANVSAEDEDAVSLLTVHASKGLEWPLVVVADLGRFPRPTKDPIMWSEGTGVRVELRDADGSDPITPASLDRMREEGKQRSREESKRLLYVAMTRARDHLILAGAQSSRARRIGPWLGWCRLPLQTSARPIGGEQDLAAGGMARAFATERGVVVRCVDSHDDEGGQLQGPRGPAADARPVLDAPRCRALARFQPPGLPQVPREVEAAAARLLDRVADPRLPPLDQGASVYTVSEVLAWKECPRRSLFEYVVGDQATRVGVASADGRGDGVPGDVRGTLVHQLLAQALTPGRPRATARRTRARLEQLIAPQRVSPGAADRVVRWAMSATRAFLASPLGLDAKSRNQTLVEHPFLVELAPGARGLLLRGTVDLLIPGTQGWILVDYKASDITHLEVPGREAKDALQIQLYSLALQGIGFPIEQALLVYLVPEVVSSVEVTPDALAGARRTLDTFAKARGSLDLPPTPGRHCRWCPWSEICPDADRRGRILRPARELTVLPG